MANGSNFREILRDNVTAVLDELAGEHLVDDYGLMEALSVDMLSEEETRAFAERLETCEYCRRECATMFATGAYEGTPFDERMKNYASETDDAWKKIAEAFDPSLKTKRNVVEAAKGNAPSVRAKNVAEAKHRTSWRQVALCASAALVGGAVVALSPDFFSDPETQSGKIAEQARVLPPVENKGGALDERPLGSKELGVPNADVSTALPTVENVWTPDAENLRLNFSVEDAKSALAKSDARRNSSAGSSLASLIGDSPESRTETASYRGALAFKEGRFAEAAAAFKEAVASETADENAGDRDGEERRRRERLRDPGGVARRDDLGRDPRASRQSAEILAFRQNANAVTARLNAILNVRRRTRRRVLKRRPGEPKRTPATARTPTLRRKNAIFWSAKRGAERENRAPPFDDSTANVFAKRRANQRARFRTDREGGLARRDVLFFKRDDRDLAPIGERDDFFGVDEERFFRLDGQNGRARLDHRFERPETERRNVEPHVLIRFRNLDDDEIFTPAKRPGATDRLVGAFDRLDGQDRLILDRNALADVEPPHFASEIPAEKNVFPLRRRRRAFR